MGDGGVGALVVVIAGRTVKRRVHIHMMDAGGLRCVRAQLPAVIQPPTPYTAGGGVDDGVRVTAADACDAGVVGDQYRGRAVGGCVITQSAVAVEPPAPCHALRVGGEAVVRSRVDAYDGGVGWG